MVICSRSQSSLELALDELKGHASDSSVVSGVTCDTSSPSAMANFAAFAKDRLGHIDRWINNAGTAGEHKRPLWELSNEDIASTCNTNLTGAVLGCAEAVRLMRDQKGASEPKYHIFNLGFSNFGANNSRTPVPHKASKLGVAALTRHLARELRENSERSIGVHEISPGLVHTELLLRDTNEQIKQIIAILAEQPEPVARVLAPKIRAARGTNTTIRHRSTLAMLWRAARCIPAISRISKESHR
ncbi:short-chain dehydrogenase/reductase SDR [Halorhodospira halochloris]|uniref:Short-chain dehydrogenase/reductase SDR n=1 Tax=Halorhodospira halochloris TaxID=1052 RepID=A0A120MZK1_HALHR|nr:short-chain dehydrogenase/reductase SDR [Halorhodospira halochloris]